MPDWPPPVAGWVFKLVSRGAEWGVEGGTLCGCPTPAGDGCDWPAAAAPAPAPAVMAVTAAPVPNRSSASTPAASAGWLVFAVLSAVAACAAVGCAAAAPVFTTTGAGVDSPVPNSSSTSAGAGVTAAGAEAADGAAGCVTSGSSGCGSNNSRRDQRIIGLGSCVCFCWGCIGAKQLIHIQRLCWLSVDWGRRHNGVSSRCALRLGLLAAAMAAEAGIASEGAMTFPAGGCRRCCAGRRRGFLSASGAERRAVR